MDTATARTRLEELRDSIDSSLVALRAEHAGETDELSHYDQHPADSASDVADAQRETALIELHENQREAVEAALRAVADGSYGTCARCGAPIGDERLEARPEALLCLRCQTLEEGRA